MKNFIGLIIFYMLCLSVQGQEREYSRLSLEVAFGMQTSIHTWKTGKVTDVFTDLSKNYFVWKIGANYYFDKNWGIQADLRIGIGENSSTQSDRLPSSIPPLYPENYYIVRPEIKRLSSRCLAGGSLGLQYRLQEGKWSFIPRLNVGFNIFNTERCYFTLKEKGGNRQYYIEYYAKGSGKGQRTGKGYIRPNIQVGYRIGKFCLNVEAGYTQHFDKLIYVLKYTELYLDGESNKITYPSKHLAAYFDFSVGASFLFYKKKRR